MEENLEEKFKAAVDIVHSMPKEGPVSSSVDEKLNFYSLYKQATVGRCNVPRPGFWNMVEKYKWDAWNNLSGMSKEEAMGEYVNKIRAKINHTMQNYETKDWIYPEVEQQLSASFDIIGCPMRRDKQESCDEVANSTLPQEVNTKSYAQVVSTGNVEPVKEEAIQSMASISDAEYCDAVEDEENSSMSPASSYDLQEEKQGRRPSLKTYSSKVEQELKKISLQVGKLSEVVESKNNMLINVFKKATVYMFVPKGVSWTTFIFFLMWPFIANFLVRLLKRYLQIR